MRGVPLLAFTKTCANGKALVRKRTLCQVFDHCPLSHPTDRGAPRGFYLAIARSIAFPAPSLGHGCDILRTAAIDVHTIIAARDPMRLAQIGAQLVPWRSIDADSKGEMTAIVLQLDGHWEGCWVGFWIAADSKGTGRLTSRARVLRVQSQRQEGNHSTAVASRNQCQAIRCLHPSAYRSWERPLSQWSLLPLPRI
jgi:hypothetical protein